LFKVNLPHEERWHHYGSPAQGKTDAVILTDTHQSSILFPLGKTPGFAGGLKKFDSSGKKPQALPVDTYCEFL